MIVSWEKPNAGLKILTAQTKENLVSARITLAPGKNDVPDHLWDAAKHNLSHDPEAKWIKEFSEKKVVEKLPAGMREAAAKKIGNGKYEISKSIPLKDVKPQEAEEIIRDTFNLKTLEKWKKEESRDSVRAAILNQIETIEKPKK